MFWQPPTKTTGETVAPHLVPVLTPAEINQGHPADPDIVLCFHPSSWEYGYSTGYYSFPMWVRALVANMAYLAKLPPQRWHLLAAPDLARGGHVTNLGLAGGDELIEAYRQARKDIAAKAAQYRKMQAAWAANQLMANYDDSRSPILVEDGALLVALAEPATRDELQRLLKGLAHWTLRMTSDGRQVWAAQVPYVDPVTVQIVEGRTSEVGTDDLMALIDELGGQLGPVLRLVPADRPGLHLSWSLIGCMAERWPLAVKDAAGAITHLAPPPPLPPAPPPFSADDDDPTT